MRPGKFPLLPARCVSPKPPSWEFAEHSVRTRSTLADNLFDSLRLLPALFNLGLGLPLSFAATRIYQSMLSGTKPLDPAVLSGVVATLEFIQHQPPKMSHARPPVTQAHTGDNR